MATPAQLAYLHAQAQARGLDPSALDAVGGMEGYSGRIGDGGHAFGPFQMNNAGGVLTGQFQGMTPEQENAWAWSNQGMSNALDRIAKVAKGLTGRAAVDAIVNNFERPANPGAERAGAYARLGGAVGPTPSPPAGSTPGLTSPQTGVAGVSGALNPGQRSLLQALKINGMDSSVVKMLGQRLGAQAGSLGTQAPAKVTPSDTQGADMGNSLVRTAMTQMGKPYQWGGGTKLGQATDCSGLIVQVYGAHGVNVPRTTYAQWKAGTPVNPNALQPGDAVYFHPGPSGPEHVGMFIGGGKFIEDPHTGSVVHIENLASYPGFMGARRFK